MFNLKNGKMKGFIKFFFMLAAFALFITSYAGPPDTRPPTDVGTYAFAPAQASLPVVIQPAPVAAFAFEQYPQVQMGMVMETHFAVSNYTDLVPDVTTQPSDPAQLCKLMINPRPPNLLYLGSVDHTTLYSHRITPVVDKRLLLPLRFY